MSNFSSAAIFSNNMVLQRDKMVKIFGEGENGASVRVEIDGIVKETVVHDEKWQVLLPPHAAKLGLTMKISCGETEFVFSNVVYGEVWLAGGQSNMELELQNCAEKDALQTDKNPNVRFYYTPKKNILDEDFYECERNTCWSEFDGESAKCWSAVGYFFARELAEKLGVVVGVIGCNWGGTSASYWMDEETLSADKDMNLYLEDIKKDCDGKSDEELLEDWREYCEYSEEWNRRSAEFYRKNPNGSWDDCQAYAGISRYPGPINKYNPMSAGALYRSMLMRVCPYTIKGFIYYQGESDDHRPRIYYKLFTALIGLWRDRWEDDTLPFLFVQLPMHRYEGDADHKHWCIIREAQMKAYNTVKNTGICIALDKGEFNEIHPKSKLPIGERLALQALYNVYGFSNLERSAFSPMYKAYEIKNGGIELSFEHCFGFKISGDEATNFEIAGSDKKFKPAKAEIKDDKIFISSNEVKEPLFARYCWTNYAQVSVFGENGLPLAPFRTSVYDEL